MIYMVSSILIFFVAVLHFFFLILEMFLWTRPLGLKVFRKSLDKAKITEVLAANQGLYNGFLSAGLAWGLIHPDPSVGIQIKFFFLFCVIIAGIFVAATVNKRIFFVQSLPALIASLVLFFPNF